MGQRFVLRLSSLNPPYVVCILFCNRVHVYHRSHGSIRKDDEEMVAHAQKSKVEVYQHFLPCENGDCDGEYMDRTGK